MSKPTLAQIDQFLSVKRVAVIGVSRSTKAYSRMLFQELLKQGYDALPVNPQVQDLDGKTCFKSIAEVQDLDGKTCFKSIAEVAPPPQRAVVILPKDKTLQAVTECARAGIRDVWVLPINGCDDEVRALAKEKELNLISGVCLFMFLPNAGWIHRMHGGILKLFGAFPK